jgi:secondary thiamine-phosphate synthase enzyme
MPCRHESFTLRTTQHHEVIDVTDRVRGAIGVLGADVGDALVTVFTPHATAAITVNENADPNIGIDFQAALAKIVLEHDAWLHDRVDDNAAAHIKAAMIGPSTSIPAIAGKLALGTWQNVFFCEFDGPRSSRRVIVTMTW